MSKTKTQTATPAKSLNLNEKYGIDKEMAHLLEFCNGHENFKKFFLNHFKRRIIVIQISDKKSDIYIWNKKYRYYERILNAKTLGKEISNLIHETWNPIYEDVKQDYNEALQNKDKEDLESIKLVKELEYLKKIVKRVIEQIENFNFLSSVLTGVLTDSTLSENELNNLDSQHDYINFRNCKVNLKTGDISKRTPDDFITEYIDFDYNEESDGDIRKKIKKTLKQICNNDKEDLEFVLSFLGYSITSETKEQKFLNLYGPLASNGKSTLIKMMNSVFGIYTTKTDRRTFNDSYTKSHKNFARMKKKRLVYVEEIEKGKVNTELLKDIVDGDKIENEILFSTTEEINIDFKLFIISNHMLRFNTDPGIARRLICMEFNSRFAEPDEYEKEKEEYKDRNVFIKDKDVNTNIDKNDDYKNAFANLIIEYAMKFYEKGLTVPEKFEKVSKELCDENDKMKQFLNDNFDITKNDDDRVSKKEFHEMYINATGLKLSDWSGLLSDIKRLNLQYDSCKKRVVYNGKSEHGVILGIKKKQHSKEEDTNDIDFIDDDERSNLSKSVVESIKQENIELKMKLEMMQLEMEQLKASLLKPHAADILDEIKGLAVVEHISTESEIDILDEINMNATIKPLHKSTAQDKNKSYKKLTKH